MPGFQDETNGTDYGSIRNRNLQLDAVDVQPSPSPQLRIDRAALTISAFNSSTLTPSLNPDGAADDSNSPRPMTPYKSIGSESMSDDHKRTFGERTCSTIFTLFPIITWVKNYNIKRDLLADILSGITVAIFQVPQSMGYCLIANVPPVYGLYTSFFPPLIYAIFGTSKHAAVGAFAIVSGVMTGQLVVTVTEEMKDQFPQWHWDDQTFVDEIHVRIATTVGLWMGIVMSILGALRLGFISIYLSPQSIAGFSCAASFYVLTTQLTHLTGAALPKSNGWLAMPYTWYNMFSHWHSINPPTLYISIGAIAIMLIGKFVLTPRIDRLQHKYLKMENALPFPMELLVVIGGTFLSWYFQINDTLDVKIVGEIKQGIPEPILPTDSILIWKCAIRSIPLMAVGFAITLSIGHMYGGKHGYQVDPNQELVSLGFCNLVSCFFGCLPATASLPRSAIQEQSGGRTQLVSLVNCVGLLVVLLLVGSLLQFLPNCILASIISVALIKLIKQIKEPIMLWKVSRIDSLQWMMSFLAVVLFDVDNGLYVGTALSLLTLIYNTSRPETYLLGSCDSTAQDVYVPIKLYGDTKSRTGVRQKTGIKIYQFCGPLHFASKDFLKQDMNRKCLQFGATHMNPSHIVLDCSMLSFVDSSGVASLRTLICEDMNKAGVKVFLASVAPHVFNMMAKDTLFFRSVPQDILFMSVHDATLYAMDEIKHAGAILTISPPSSQ